MSAKLTSLVTAHYILLARSFVFILGCIAVWWGIIGFSVFWQQSSTGRIASRIIAGDPFKVEILARQLPNIDSIERSVYCRPAALRSAAIIHLRMMEAMISAGERDKVDAQMKPLGNSIRNSLSCLPADPFLWVVLYWVANSESEFKPNYFKYLRMSYQSGPNEGWIAIKRNPVTLAVFEQLPTDLAEMATSEFAKIIDAGLYNQAVAILTGPGWRIQDLLLRRLEGVTKEHRQAFANALYWQGYDIKVPGIELPGSRRQ